MPFVSVFPLFFKFEKEGQDIIGYYRGLRTSKDGTQEFPEIETVDGQVYWLPSHASLLGILRKYIQEGDYIKIVYKGEEKAKGKTFKRYEVYRDTSVRQQASQPAQPAVESTASDEEVPF